MSAQRDARYSLRMSSMRTMRLIGADECACQRIVLLVLDPDHGWDRLCRTRSVTEPRAQNKATHESSNADSTLSTSHSLTSELRLRHSCVLEYTRERTAAGGTAEHAGKIDAGESEYMRVVEGCGSKVHTYTYTKCRTEMTAQPLLSRSPCVCLLRMHCSIAR